MMYAKGNLFISDFIERTKTNYDWFCHTKDAYEVTQLINSALGLLIVPEQRLYDEIEDNLLPPQLFKKIKNSIIMNTYTESTDLKTILKHIRNGLAHSKIEAYGTKPVMDGEAPVINGITISDCNNRTKDRFKITISIDLLRELLIEFSSAMVNLINSDKQRHKL